MRISDWSSDVGSSDLELDASLLLVPLTGFLPPADPRVTGTVEAIRRDLVEDGLVLRYRPERAPDGLEGTEGTFLVCSFWLADALTMVGLVEEATELLDRRAGLRHDRGLLAAHTRTERGRGKR